MVHRCCFQLASLLSRFREEACIWCILCRWVCHWDSSGGGSLSSAWWKWQLWFNCCDLECRKVISYSSIIVISIFDEVDWHFLLKGSLSWPAMLHAHICINNTSHSILSHFCITGSNHIQVFLSCFPSLIGTYKVVNIRQDSTSVLKIKFYILHWLIFVD